VGDEVTHVSHDTLAPVPKLANLRDPAPSASTWPVCRGEGSSERIHPVRLTNTTETVRIPSRLPLNAETGELIHDGSGTMAILAHSSELGYG
jgi:hypothetical protein